MKSSVHTLKKASVSYPSAEFPSFYIRTLAEALSFSGYKTSINTLGTH